MDMKAILVLFFGLSMNSITTSDLIFNFGSDQNQISNWVLLSDNVMGGVTKSNLEYTKNTLILKGDISLRNYGGFASVKTQFGKYDISQFKGVKIKFKSANQKFAFTLEDSNNWTLPNYKGAFSSTSDNTWEEQTIYFKDFKEYKIGEATGKKLDDSKLKNIVRMGVMTTEKKEGPFSIEIDFIEFVK
jgi:NADH dehydrogenase [ubiquinone] 1 alpha subcomplex assembly factor 1